MTINTTDLTLFQRETSPGSGTYVTIAQVIDIDPPERKRKKVVQPTMDSSVPYTKYGAYEDQQVVIDLAFDNDMASHQQFHTDQDSKALISYRIVWPNPGARMDTFSATIESIKESKLTAEGDVQKSSITLGISGTVSKVW